MTAPTGVDDALVEKARELARAQGRLPSRNAIKVGLRVGSDKAAAVLDRLVADQRARRDNSRRGLRAIARRGSQAHPRRRSLTGLRAGLSAPTSPIVGPYAPTIPPQVAPPAAGSKPTPTSPQPPRPETPRKRVATWPAKLVALPAAVAIWAGWVALGGMTAFGRVNLLPGIKGGLVVDTAITLPIGVEAYAAYAFYVALAPHAPARARRFAARSSGLAVVLGMGGQAAFHLMTAAGWTAAPWPVTTLVSCLPVAVFAMAARLVHHVLAGEVSDDRTSR